MKTFILTGQQSVTALLQHTEGLDTGLIVVAGSEHHWVDFVLLGLLGSYQMTSVTIVSKNSPNDTHFFPHLAPSHELVDDCKQLNYYGTVRDTEFLKQALESAQERVTVCAMHVTSPIDVTIRMRDLLGDQEENFNTYQNLVTCIVSQDVKSAERS